MKLWIIFVLALTQTVFAEVPVCSNIPQSSEVTQEDEFCKITRIKGPLAEERYRALEAPEESPRPNTFPADYLLHAVITAKYSKNLNCWKVQAPVYHIIDGQQKYMGPQGCVQFSCNIIEHKQQ